MARSTFDHYMQISHESIPSYIFAEVPHAWLYIMVSYGVKRPQPFLMNGSHSKHICNTS